MKLQVRKENFEIKIGIIFLVKFFQEKINKLKNEIIIIIFDFILIINVNIY